MKINLKLIGILCLALMTILICITEYNGYNRFYSGEHNIDLGYNTKNSSFKYDIMSTGEIVETTYLYRLGGNQIREANIIFLKARFLYLLFGLIIGILAALEITNKNGGKSSR